LRAAQAEVTGTTPSAIESSDAGSRSSKADPETVGPESRRAKREAAAQTANTVTQTAQPLLETPNWFPLATAPVSPGVASLSQASVSSQSSTQAQNAESTIVSASTSAFASSAFARWSSDAGATESPGAVAAVTHNRAEASDSGARTMRAGQSSPQHSTTESPAAHETQASSLGDASDAAANGLSISSNLSKSAADTQSGLGAAAQTDAAGENPSNHSLLASKTDNATHSEIAGSAKPSAGSHGSASGAAPVSAAQDASKETPERSAPSMSSGAATQETVSSATPWATAQPASADAAGLRIQAPAHVSATPASGHTPVVAGTSSQASVGDTFTALDRESSLGTPAWTHAGGQHAEAGFQDPDLGWVGVRADLNTSGIHATLVPSSADAAQSLSGHLAGLSSHLVEQQAPLASLSMASPGESGIENGMGQGMQQGAEGNAQGNAAAESQATAQTDRPLEASTSTQVATAESGVADTQAYPGELRGRHISVMA
jgi:hypothetical protein